MNNDILVIADTQVDNNTPTEHLVSLSKYIWKNKPAHIVHIGDHWDLPSLSSYVTNAEKEGRRLKDDLEGGERALKLIMEHPNQKNKSGKRVKYKPNLHFIMGNHENRLNRFIQDNPILTDMINIESLVEAEGWKVHNFLEPLFIEDICFIHFMPNPESGRPVGGSIENKLNKFPHSFVHGHQQKFQYGRRQNLKGKPHFGVCAGSFYMHDENYRGANNTEIRGFVHIKSFENRYGYPDHDVEFVSLERLIKQY